MNIIIVFYRMDKNLYLILEIDKNASKETIRKAYLKAAIKYHPDKCNDPPSIAHATEKFNEIKMAYDILYDDDKRRRYDQKMLKKNDYESKGGESDISNLFGIITVLIDKYKLNTEEKQYLYDNIDNNILYSIINRNSDEKTREDAIQKVYEVIKKIAIRRLARQNEFFAILLNNLDT